MAEKKSTGKAVAAGLLLAAALIAMVIFLIYVLTPKSSAGSDDSAASRPEFSDPNASSESDFSLAPPAKKASMSEAEVGDLVYFGRYAQEPEETGDGSPIEWIVLDKLEDRLLLISYRCLETAPYNTERDVGITGFDQSSLCAFLNGDFASAAFGDRLESVLGDDGSKVFILNAEDAGRYLTPDSHRVSRLTARAAEKSGLEADKNAIWWLADVTGEGAAAYVYTDGSIRTKGFAFDYSRAGVRPAIWVSADATAE